MLPRTLLIGLGLGLGLACTVTSNDDSAGTGSSSGSAGPTGTSGSSSATTQAGESSGSGGPTTGGPVTGSGTSETGNAEAGASSTGAPGTGETGNGGVSFTDVYEQVLLPNGCTSGYCHGGGAGGLTMTDEATSYANLVEVDATAAVCDQSVRVVPGSIEQSVLWSRVRPAAQDPVPACAPKMPQGAMGLSEAEAQLVDEWIAGGALE